MRRGRVRVLLMLVVSKRCKGEEAHLLEVPVHVLGQLAEEHAEQGGEERAGEVEPLGAKVVAVVELAALERGEEEAVHHVAEEEGLLGVLPGRHRHVREHLLLEDLLGVVDAAVARQGRDGAAAADEVESDLRVRMKEERERERKGQHELVEVRAGRGEEEERTATHVSRLDRERVLETGLHELEHLGVGALIHDVVEDVLVGDDVERAEDDDDRNVGADVGDRALHRRARLALGAAHHLDLERRDRLAALLDGRPDLGEVRDGRRLRLGEHVDAVRRHALLSDEDLLRAVDDEVAALLRSEGGRSISQSAARREARASRDAPCRTGTRSARACPSPRGRRGCRTCSAA